jgi:hypothetical protein
MHRRIMIIFATAVAALALAAAPAGAGAGNMELYALPNYTGTHSSVPPGTLDDYLDSCVTISTLTSSVLTEARSAQNFTSLTVDLYSGTSGCISTNFIKTLGPNVSWSMLSGGQPAKYAYVTTTTI